MIRWEEPAAHVGLAIIDRPERRNALNAEMCDELRSHLKRSHRLRAVVIVGEGTAFCAGADIVRRATDVGGLEHGGSDSFRPAFELLLDAIESHRAPVIAAIQGPALGAGTQLAVACDFRVVGQQGTFGIPASKLGIILSSANISRLSALVGNAVARDLLVTSRQLDREAADALGLVTRRVNDVRREAVAFAIEIAGLAPLTVQGHKRALNLVNAVGALSPAAVEEIRALEQEAFLSDDLQEGLVAFADKRAPDFRGR